MNGNGERRFAAVDADGIIEGSRLTFKIDKLCIKLGINKAKGDAQKCNHFSLRGYVAGMREKGSKNVLPFTKQLPPMDVPNFRYWLCQRCLQNNETENGSKVCEEVAVFPFGEGTSGVKPVDDIRNDNENIVTALQTDERQPAQEISKKDELSQEIPEKFKLSQEIPEKIKVFQEFPKFCSIQTNATASGCGETNENPQKTSVNSLLSQPIESGQQNESPNGNPRRKARKVRLLKELLCGNSQLTESGQQKKGNFQIKRKILHDHDHDHDNDPDQRIVNGKRVKTFKGNDHDHDHEQRIVDGKKVKTFNANDCDYGWQTQPETSANGKKVKNFNGNSITKNRVADTSKNVETSNYQWKKHGAERSSILGKTGGDPRTAWRTIFSDMRTENQVPPSSSVSKKTSAYGKKVNNFNGNSIAKNSVAETSKNVETSKHQWKNHRAEKSPMTAWRTIFSDMRTDNQVPPSSSVPKCRETEPDYSLMGQPKSNKKVNFSKKIANNNSHLKSKHFVEDLRKTKDRNRELGLGLSLNYDPQLQLKSAPFVSNGTISYDPNRKTAVFMGELNSANRIPFGLNSKEGLGYDVSNVNANRTVFLQEKRPYTEFPYGSCSGHQNLDFSDPIARSYNPQRQENMFSIGRSDEHEIIELLAKNQYERNLSESRTHFAASGTNNNGIALNTPSFHNFNMNEGMTRKTSENVGPTATKNPYPDPVSGFFRQEHVSSSGVWISDSRHQIPKYSHFNRFSNGNNERAHMYVYPQPNTTMPFGQPFSQPLSQPFSQPFSQPYAKYLEKDKGKNMMDLDLNVMASNVVEEHNNSESLNSLDSSYYNEAIPAMQLLSLMDAGKSSQPFNKNGQKCSTKTNCRSTVTEKSQKTNSMVNSPFPNSRMTSGLPKPIPSPFPTIFQTGQNVKFTYSQSQQVYHKQQKEKSDSYVFPLPAANERNKVVVNDVVFVNGVKSSRTEICTVNRNPADFTTPGPDNVYMINPEDMRFKSATYGYGPKRQNINGFQ